MATPVKGRNAQAVTLALRNGGGKHADRRTKRNRTRAAQKRTALREWSA